MSRFSRPGRSIKDLCYLIGFGGVVTLVFHYWATPKTELSLLDMVGWLAEPTVFVVFYLTVGRGWGGVGLSARVSGQGRWFLFSLSFAPILAAVLLLTNHLAGLMPFKPTTVTRGLLIGLAGVATFAAKNIFEEFVFRGFLTSRFADTQYAGLKGHVLTGVIWSVWHLAYWFTFLPYKHIAGVSGLSSVSFAGLGVVTLTLQSILLGELRMITGSIWSGVLLRTMNSVFLVGLVAANAVPKGTMLAMIFTPVEFGLLYAGAMAIVGVWISINITPQSNTHR